MSGSTISFYFGSRTFCITFNSLLGFKLPLITPIKFAVPKSREFGSACRRIAGFNETET